MASYNHLSDQELLDEVRDAAARSPVIAELHQRLEKYTTAAPEVHELDCPVCAAPLKIEVDDGDITVK